jgi:hypothetical protein
MANKSHNPAVLHQLIAKQGRPVTAVRGDEVRHFDGLRQAERELDIPSIRHYLKTGNVHRKSGWYFYYYEDWKEMEEHDTV